MPGYNFEPKTF